MNIKGILFGGEGGGSAAADFGLLLLRVGAGGALAYFHGVGKFPVTEKAITGASDLGFPVPALFAWAAALSELVGGALVAIGFLTRPAAFFALCTMATAFFLAHAADPFERKEKAFLFGLAFLCLLFTGAGRYSIDALYRRPSRHG